MRRLFALGLSLGLMVASVVAQDSDPSRPGSLAGSYQVKNPNGQPLDPTGIDRVVFVPIHGSPLFFGVSTFDDGSGPVVIDDPVLTYIAMPAAEGKYRWQSLEEGHHGQLVPTREGYRQEYTNPAGAQPNRFDRE
jgi:hypothetical protein